MAPIPASKLSQIAEILQSIGYHSTLIYPLLPTYALLIVSAISPIYTGAHASLSRPASASKPAKRRRKSDAHTDDDEDDNDGSEDATKMEGLSPMDAVFIPIFAGLSLGGFYLLIKWLDDPAILSKIISAYFSIFGTVAMSKLLADAMGLAHDLVFPRFYRSLGTSWTVNAEQRYFDSAQKDKTRPSPLPGVASLIPLPKVLEQGLWSLREAPTKKVHIKAYIHNILSASLKIGPYGILSAALAFCISLYMNFVRTPWYLNNLSAFAFVYTVFQLMTPTTAWTATLILGGLFVYDIYFVFYTPLMVTVATKLDIPAKMLFPRPEGMSMLGLGDIAIPGMVIGFALRFDLWLYYFRQQKRKPEAEQNGRLTRSATKSPEKGLGVEKPKYRSATGLWGTRFWAGSSKGSDSSMLQGQRFPKPYFFATLTGYLLGILCTLLIMQIFMHAQPALLYLVPGVMGALWSTALFRGELRLLWRYRDDLDDDGFSKLEGKTIKEKGWWGSFVDIIKRTADDELKTKAKANGTVKEEGGSDPDSPKRGGTKSTKPEPEPWYKGHLVYLSLSLPPSSPSSPRKVGESESSKSTPTRAPKHEATGAKGGMRRRRRRSTRKVISETDDTSA